MNKLATAMAIVALAATLAGAEEATARGLRYEARSELGEADAGQLARELDLRFEAFQRLFRFDPALLPSRLKARAFKDEASFDAYLTEALGETRDGASYLHYAKSDRSELLIVRDGKESTARAFAHQSFVQYLRAFIPNPPAWIREGFAIFFDTLGYDAEKGELHYEENLAWLDSVKAWGTSAPSPQKVLTADANAEASASMSPSVFQGASWALVSFLLNTGNEDYRRSMYEGFMLLDPEASAAANAMTFADRLGRWTDVTAAGEDFAAYMAGRKTFTELIEAGRTAYSAKDAEKAEDAFLDAGRLRPTHYAPHYYLGLIAYERKDYALAENQYRTSLQLGADEALVSYALGVNAAADGRNEDARTYLTKAKSADPARYGTRAEELMARLK
ncbi:MAG: hypothetical protein A2Z99_04155 [Treponema sp. GWB1_62_6]|nr:MAG: hypothetical protein A2001_17360 [Treponema sp. GWC1_61_84]OHE66566.1 MAG: hypothetical protein A2Y36_00380 [Treponema sp. GWA1_62_8]OHE71024.1 MAG: hypothetical protein A2Z99_04155 [Treponema sp. GWB1_62_6]OHE76036.1 MAG: hypothetical protein A2413_17535 [Treponema sp. RIFOXYC1_FULL_61_9]HCM26809.1 hypothetical protein [Treponema sp.]